MTVRFVKLNKDAKIPVYSSAAAAGADLCSLPGDDITILPGETVMIHTGLSMEIPEGCAAFIFARSGLASKRGLAPANKVGVVDSDYRGEVMVALHNHSASVQTIAGGERIAQMVIMPFVRGEFAEAESLTETDRGIGGFGSTGKM
ncbi:MAG: dUTP diphosphatase [Ruminococcaceae bacterium]|nr:dUTP diphosphatase [Oscillospiraceae bacterium]MBQ3599011.1 dUTP diphosphatase [Clostridia bacterium]